MGVAWSLGHALTLFAVGGIVISLDSVLPERIAQILEFGVGLMLVWLGADVIRRLIIERIHLHIHRHTDGTTHFHAHSHRGDGAHDTSKHRHSHHRRFPVRALLVGLMHGMAGSAALIVLTLGQIQSLTLAIAYLAIFGIGSMLGMAGLTAAIAVPLSRAARSITWAHRAIQVCVGAGTIGLGGWTIYETGIPVLVG
jgi:ABC-type nickel/cobalt efflux system permease component RcnA